VDYRTLDTLRQKYPAWRLLVADHAPLIVSFLHKAFVQPNIRTLSQPDLASRLDDYLYTVRLELGTNTFPREASLYLENWASDEYGWLRKYYPADSDVPHFDITPATEKAIDWLANLGQRQFVGTESRLMMVFELLHQLVEGTEKDPWARIGELERRRSEIDSEIERIRQGHPYVLDATRIKERFVQLSSTARGLLSDFREVEQNFRDLDRGVRERIATFDGGKGVLLEEIFGDHDAITDSDQGRSFRAFWDFLMSPARQDELSVLLAKVFDLDPVKEMQPDQRLLRIHYDWLQAGEVAQRTVARLSEQLRRYLDDKAWLENRRIMQLIRDVEQIALSIRGAQPDQHVIELDQAAPEIHIAMDRPLFEPPLKSNIDDVAVAGDEDIPYDALFSSVYVDKARLAANIRQALQNRSQISLDELVLRHPLEQGLAELVTYFSLVAEDREAIIDDAQRKTLTWMDEELHSRQATLPLVIFCRASHPVAG
jgi:hypothetical protein